MLKFNLPTYAFWANHARQKIVGQKKGKKLLPHATYAIWDTTPARKIVAGMVFLPIL